MECTPSVGATDTEEQSPYVSFWSFSSTGEYHRPHHLPIPCTCGGEESGELEQKSLSLIPSLHSTAYMECRLGMRLATAIKVRA